MTSIKAEIVTIAVAGNPNAGKTTVFNTLAGARQKVANYPGVTVERKEAILRLPDGTQARLIDLPGCYSLTARSPEEQIAHDVLFGRIPDCPTPSLVLCVVDASNLERSLYLVTQFLDQGIPLAVILNMMDIAREKGVHLDPEKLSETLGCPVIPTVARTGEGMDRVREGAARLIHSQAVNGRALRPFIEELPSPVAEAVSRLASQLNGSTDGGANQRSRPEALWALLGNLEGDEAIRLPPLEVRLTRETLADFNLSTSDLRKQESEARYQYIGRILQTAGVRHEDHPHTLTERLDSVLLHPFIGPALFVAVFALLFQGIFAWAGPAMDAIDAFFGWLGGGIEAALPESLFRDLLVEGVLSGVGNTVIFLPQILILFFFLGLLEDSGYLARAAFLMDRLMSSIGLDGKAFIPLLSSFACAIPGIMATRTIPNRKDRLVTILIAPLMACSARLPVYVLLIGTVFAAEERVLGVFNLGGLVMFALYFSGILGAVLIAALFKKSILRGPKPVLLLELPTYKLPSLKGLGFLLWDKSLQFLKRAGTVILSVTILLWALLSFPRGSDLAHSWGGRLGHALAPVIEPLGFDWKIGVGLVSSFAAREVFVSTMGVIYGIGDEATEEDLSLREAMRAERRPGTDQPLYTPLVGFSLMLFYVFACQCMSTIAVARRETNSWRWPALMFAYMTVLAWSASFTVYQVGSLLGFE